MEDLLLILFAFALGALTAGPLGYALGQKAAAKRWTNALQVVKQRHESKTEQ